MFLTRFPYAKNQGVLKQFSGKAKKGVQTLNTTNGPNGKDRDILQKMHVSYSSWIYVWQI